MRDQLHLKTTFLYISHIKAPHTQRHASFKVTFLGSLLFIIPCKRTTKLKTTHCNGFFFVTFNWATTAFHMYRYWTRLLHGDRAHTHTNTHTGTIVFTNEAWTVFFIQVFIDAGKMTFAMNIILYIQLWKPKSNFFKHSVILHRSPTTNVQRVVVEGGGVVCCKQPVYSVDSVMSCKPGFFPH